MQNNLLYLDAKYEKKSKLAPYLEKCEKLKKGQNLDFWSS